MFGSRVLNEAARQGFRLWVLGIVMKERWLSLGFRVCVHASTCRVARIFGSWKSCRL